MELDEHLHAHFAERAAEVQVEFLSIGLGYTAVKTSDQGLGLAYTYLQEKKSCSVISKNNTFEGRPALELLQLIKSSHPLERSMALALINALNHGRALKIPEDRDNQVLFRLLGIGQGSNIAMVGYFGPLINKIHQLGGEVEVIDFNRKVGDQSMFLERLKNWAEILIMTSTTILNSTTEDILSGKPPEVRAVMIGPSTPLLQAPFAHLPLDFLAGTVPLQEGDIFRAIRHGKGTPALQKFSKKPVLELHRPF